MIFSKSKLFLFFIFTSLILVSCKQNSSQILQQTAEQISKSCPRQVDYMTSLEGCEYIPENTLKYNYTVSSDIPKDQIEIYHQVVKENVENSMAAVFQKHESEDLKKLNPTFLHCYKNKMGETLFEIKITPEMYKNPKQASIPNSEEEIFDYLKKMAVLSKPSTPIEVDEGIFLLDTRAIGPRTMEYDYCLSNMKAEGFDSIDFQQKMKAGLIAFLKNDVSSKTFRDYKTTFRYRYFDANRHYLCITDITSADYQ